MANALNHRDSVGMAQLGLGGTFFPRGLEGCLAPPPEQAIHLLRESDQPRIWAHSWPVALVSNLRIPRRI